MRLAIGFLVIAALGAVPTSTWAQGECYDAYLVGSYDGTKVQLRLSVGSRTFSTLCRGNAVAFDVFRSTMGPVCGPEVRITDQPIAWPVGPPHSLFEVTFDDFDVTPGTGYQYEARPVDAQRNRIGDLTNSAWGWAPAGTTLLAHGQLWTEGGGVTGLVSSQPCPGECFANGIVGVPVELRQYVDTGVTVTLYGDAVGVTGPISNAWFPTLTISSGRVAPCVISVAPMPWGSVKRLYE